MTAVDGKISDFMAVAVERPRKCGSLEAIITCNSIRGDNCRRKDLPSHINIRRQDKAFAVIRRIGSKCQ